MILPCPCMCIAISKSLIIVHYTYVNSCSPHPVSVRTRVCICQPRAKPAFKCCDTLTFTSPLEVTPLKSFLAGNGRMMKLKSHAMKLCQCSCAQSFMTIVNGAIVPATAPSPSHAEHVAGGGALFAVFGDV
jgi:hypothetical protein